MEMIVSVSVKDTGETGSLSQQRSSTGIGMPKAWGGVRLGHEELGSFTSEGPRRRSR